MIHNKLSEVRFGRFWRNKVVALVLLLLVLLFGAGTVSSHPHTIPTISVTSVKSGESVTIQTYNFPAGYTFNVTMGKMYSRGVGGIHVGDLYSGSGGSFSATFDIPAELKDDARIAIRTQTAHKHPFYSYNWFYNNTTTDVGTTLPVVNKPIYTGIPTFKITAVDKGNTVTIETNNFPANQTFAVTMGKMYTRGIGGEFIENISSGAGGTLTFEFDIPDALKNDDRIAIRAQTAHANPYYAFNWFYNNDAPGTVVSPTPVSPVSVYYGIPTFKVCQVVKDSTVEILTKNFPTNQTFAVTMGAMYTRGINGFGGQTLNSEGNASARYTFNIPAEMKGSHRISIRTQTAHAHPFYSYNWFYNNSTTTPHC